ncbi:MAG: inositol monophosphatase family protein [Planctomycetota bacterium]
MLDIAIAAGQETLQHFGATTLEVESKSDASPVTIADRAAERRVREIIKADFGSDAVLGEEFDPKLGSSGYRWVVDPIDGTKSFICGVPLYSTLLALELVGGGNEDSGEPTVNTLGGVILIPALGEIVVAAQGLGAWNRRGQDAWIRSRVSNKSSIDQAIFVTSQVDSFDRRQAGDAYKRLESESYISRTWGDGYGYLMVATGRADIMVDPICNAWDVAAIAPIVEEAGGKFTDWKGVATTRGGDGIGTNGHLHDAVLNLLG